MASSSAAPRIRWSPLPNYSAEWKSIHGHEPSWYASGTATTIASHMLFYQNDDGGWPKNIDMTQRSAAKDASTIDNEATTTQLTFLAKVFAVTHDDRYQASFLRGLDYLLRAQYPNGGFPQFFPNPVGYQTHITFNDGAMTNVLTLLSAVGNRSSAYAFVDEGRARQCSVAVQKGVECILRCQIVVDGKKRGWCAQHDEVTFLPASARSYELPSESGLEGAQILRFLMSLDAPSPAVVAAVQAAVRWFRAVQIRGIRVEFVGDPSVARRDKIIVEDPAAPPLWARFYEIETQRPLFCGRDGVKKYTMAEVERERRAGYSWYVDLPGKVLTQYPSWQVKWAPGDDALAAP